MKPKKIFLIDGLGAAISALLLGVVLIKFNKMVGIPEQTLYFLASLPVFVAAYDFFCFFKLPENIGLFLRGTAYFNIAYCCISLGFAFYHFETITYFCLIYFFIEIIIVITLAKIEFRTARSISS